MDREEHRMNLLQKIWISIIGLVALVSPALAGNLTIRPWATGTITPIPTYRLANITELIGGNTSKVDGPNFGLLIMNSVAMYSDYVGMIVYVIFFAMPFIMMWIVQADMTMPAIIGMLFSLYVFARLPEQYILFAVGCFIICVAALVWSLYKRSY